MSYNEDLDTERKGIDLAYSLIKTWSMDGREPINTNDAKNRELWQRTIGDYVIVSKSTGCVSGLEMKTEKRYTGNLFIETWSNCALGELRRDGWIFSCKADYIVNVYLDIESAFLFRMRELWEHLIVNGNLYINLKEIPVHQSTNGQQKNLTKGVPYPFKRLIDENVPCSIWKIIKGEWQKAQFSEIPQPQRYNGAVIHV